jgi:hypothetical protein
MQIHLNTLHAQPPPHIHHDSVSMFKLGLILQGGSATSSNFERSLGIFWSKSYQTGILGVFAIEKLATLLNQVTDIVILTHHCLEFICIKLHTMGIKLDFKTHDKYWKVLEVDRHVT